MPDAESIGTERSSRRERERARHRREALAAAERLLAELPYTAISVQRIAAEAEFSVGYLYKLFPSKDDLYLSLVGARKDELLEAVRAAAGRAPEFRRGLLDVVRAVEDWIRRHPGLARDNRAELLALFQRRRDHERSLLDRDRLMQPLLVELFRRGIAAGEVAGAPPEEMARTLRALIWGFLGDAHRGGEERPVGAATIVEILLRTYSRVWTEDD